MAQINNMNPPAIVAVATDHLFILQGHAVPMQEFEKWAKGMQQITAGGHGQMTVQNALETYMSYSCLLLSDLQFAKTRDMWNPEILPDAQPHLYDGNNPRYLYPRTDDGWRRMPMTTILEWLRSFVLKSTPQGSASRSSAETMISKIRMGPDFIANPKTVELFYNDVWDVEREFPDTNQVALSKLLVNDFNSKIDRNEAEIKQFKYLHDEVIKGEFMRSNDLSLMKLIARIDQIIDDFRLAYHMMDTAGLIDDSAIKITRAHSREHRHGSDRRREERQNRGNHPYGNSGPRKFQREYRSNTTSKNDDDTPLPKCTGCGFVGHIKKDCKHRNHTNWNHTNIPFAESPIGKVWAKKRYEGFSIQQDRRWQGLYPNLFQANEK